MKIAVFAGGSSAEREVSLNSGKAVAEALREAGHDAVMHDVQWGVCDSLLTTVEQITRDGTEVVYLALHGGLGENGGVQGVLEAAGMPYTGSGICASAIAMDKHVSKALFARHDIPTAPWLAGTINTIREEDIATIIGYPCVVKPVDQGSTIGLSKVDGPEDFGKAVENASAYGAHIMVERFVGGSELTVPVLGDRPLPVIEIRPSHDLYDYTCKYTAGMTDYLVPAPIDPMMKEVLQDLALRTFTILGLRDLARIDFRLNADGKPFCFEANTLPGMTATSLVPKSAAVAGIGFSDLVSRVAHMAFERKRM